MQAVLENPALHHHVDEVAKEIRKEIKKLLKETRLYTEDEDEASFRKLSVGKDFR